MPTPWCLPWLPLTPSSILLLYTDSGCLPACMSRVQSARMRASELRAVLLPTLPRPGQCPFRLPCLGLPTTPCVHSRVLASGIAV